ncbi:MAG: hypothetical protein OES47_08920 [Acidobacteriota bacterium]|nr:hypothetical protein [Acidobacteriota bacterium]
MSAVVRRRRPAALLLSIPFLSLVASGGHVRAESPPSESLFDSHETLRLTVRAPLRALVESTKEDHDTDLDRRGSIALAEGPEIPVTTGVFGKSRLKHCTMPPLVLDPDPVAARGTLFEDHSPLRIVTHCGYETGSDRWALLEYLAYRTYQIVADIALSVRLAEIEYHDTGRNDHKQIAYGFLVEDINVAARDRGLEWLTLHRQSPSQIDPDQTIVLALFQFMIGNTDWSVLRGPAGERCCHNMAVLGGETTSERQLLPFDFDQAGLVDAPYSQPSATVKLRNVRQRRYRGFCVHNDSLPAAVELFNQKRPLIEELFNDASLPHPKIRQHALRYVTNFFELINNSKRLEKHILQRCRSRSAN